MNPLLFLSEEEKRKVKYLAFHAIEVQKQDSLKKISLMYRDKPDRNYTGIQSEIVGLYDDESSTITLLDLINLEVLNP
jgi:hypothetical protein